MSTSTDYNPRNMVTGYSAATPPAPTYYNPNLSHEDVQPEHPQLSGKVVLVIYSLFACAFGGIIYSIQSIPDPKHPDFRVDAVSIPSFNTSSQNGTVNWSVDFVVGNPNNYYDDDFIFDPIVVSSSYQKNNNSIGQKNILLSGTVMNPFSLTNGTETKMSAKFAILGTVLDDVYSQNIGGQNSEGVKFDFKLTGGVHFAGGDFVHSMDILCSNVLVGFVPDTRVGGLSGGPEKCHVSW